MDVMVPGHFIIAKHQSVLVMYRKSVMCLVCIHHWFQHPVRHARFPREVCASHFKRAGLPSLHVPFLILIQLRFYGCNCSVNHCQAEHLLIERGLITDINISWIFLSLICFTYLWMVIKVVLLNASGAIVLSLIVLRSVWQLMHSWSVCQSWWCPLCKD